MRLESFNISINSSIFFVIVGIILLAAYSFYIYKFTIPQVSKTLKYFLIALRTAALILLFFLIFEPVVNLTSSQKVEPVTLVFVDNSNSIAAKDSAKRSGEVKNFIKECSSINAKVIPFTFSSKIKNFSADSLQLLYFKGQSTNFSNIISELKKSELNISSAVIISDGIINDGADPVFDAEKLQFPVFTVGIGDTTHYRDVQIKDALFNQYIYAQRATEIEANISQFGFDSKSIRATLFEDNKPVASQDAQLNASGMNKIKFDYTPEKPGDIKMRIALSPLPGEINLVNNSKTFFVNVLQNKIKVCLISGSPSADVSAIATSLESDKNLDIKKIIQISQNKFWKSFNPAIIDSSDILFLINFPASNISSNLFQQTVSAIRNKNKPFFFLLSQNVDAKKLKEIENYLPFSILKVIEGSTETSSIIVDNSFNSVFSGVTNQTETWNNLPPLLKTNSTITPKPGSDILLKSVMKKTLASSPLLIARNIGNQRSIAFIADDIWKWELLTSEKYPGFLSNIILDFTKWLKLSEKQKQFSVRTSEKIYAGMEPVLFTAELYDQTFSPIDSADIKVNINKNGKSFELTFSNEKPGMFSATLESPEPGDYSYEAEAKFNNTILKSEKGRFIVGESNIEKENTRMNEDFLRLLAGSTNGSYYSIGNYSGLIKQLEYLKMSASKDKLSSREIDFRSNEWIMLLIICLFAVEWFIRKRLGMI
jgi:hypothetical protein